VSGFFTPEFFVDPYPTYEELRDEPVHWNEELRAWVLTGYREVSAALSDPRVSRGDGPRDGDLLTRLLTRMMLFTDPPDHTRLRALANRAFTPRRVEALRPRIAAIVDEQLDEVDEGEWDLIEGLAYPLPVIVIAEILSLPRADRGLFKRWSDDVIAVAAGVGDDPERRKRGLRSADALAEYLEKVRLVSHDIAAAKFYKRPGRQCAYCDFLPVCLGNKKKTQETLVKIA